MTQNLKTNGFTLIDLLIIMVVLFILAAMLMQEQRKTKPDPSALTAPINSNHLGMPSAFGQMTIRRSFRSNYPRPMVASGKL